MRIVKVNALWEKLRFPALRCSYKQQETRLLTKVGFLSVNTPIHLQLLAELVQYLSLKPVRFVLQLNPVLAA